MNLLVESSRICQTVALERTRTVQEEERSSRENLAVIHLLSQQRPGDPFLREEEIRARVAGLQS